MSRLCSFTPQQIVQPVFNPTSSAQFHAGTRFSTASQRRSRIITAASATCTLTEERTLPASWSHLPKQVEGVASEQESTPPPVRITNDSCQLLVQPRVLDGVRLEVLPHPGQVLADRIFPPAAAKFFSNELKVTVNPGSLYQPGKHEDTLLNSSTTQAGEQGFQQYENPTFEGSYTSQAGMQGFQNYENPVFEESYKGSYSKTTQADSQEAHPAELNHDNAQDSSPIVGKHFDEPPQPAETGDAIDTPQTRVANKRHRNTQSKAASKRQGHSDANAATHQTVATSAYLGVVSWLPGISMWQARINVNGKSRFIGLYDSEEEAAKAYNRACVAQAPAQTDHVNPTGRKQTKKQATKHKQINLNPDSGAVDSSVSMQHSHVEHVCTAATKPNKTKQKLVSDAVNSPEPSVGGFKKAVITNFPVSWTGPSLPTVGISSTVEAQQQLKTSKGGTDYIKSTKGSDQMPETDKTSARRNTMVTSKLGKQMSAPRPPTSGSVGSSPKFLVLSKEEQVKLAVACQDMMALEKIMSHMKHSLSRAPSLEERAKVVGMEPDELMLRLLAGAQAKQRLLAACKGLMYKEAKREYRNLVKTGKSHMISVLDLIEEGKKGVLHAIKKFDPAANCKFTTYAVPWIRQAIRRCVHNECALIRMSCSLAEDSIMLSRKMYQLQAASGTEPSIPELAQALKWNERRVQSAMEAYKASFKLGSITSLDITSKDEDDGNLAESMSANTFISQDGLATSSMGQTEVSQENVFRRKDLQAAIVYASQELSQDSPQLMMRTRAVLERLLGLHADDEGMHTGTGAEMMSAKAISREMGIPVFHVQSLKQKGMAILRERSADVLEALLKEDAQHAPRSTAGAHKKHS